ncbi:lipopolysaccharide heptosyltransferase RfaC [Zophobihabitans entericus]|uniref:Lipopolysaccharide heptosyltransferase 1 n=1 Tax=Zophobihabitans entericus TaxID=1635327 RepID=A0A6G9IC11_9GAMM|nr:lipopolysaccharide heptosyltransferase RfaC [Zophobihabitans entericus]QIQ21120.1 lipopolysaccharide heptosyltransferase RfaC [Zophobihabitans entericus]
MRVLIVKTSSMGDVLHTLPAITDASKAIPDITFDWVVEENFTQIPSWHAAVHRVLPVAIRRWRKSWFSRSTRFERRRFIKLLQEQEYDCVIDAQGLIKSAFLITRKAKGVKHGLDKNSAREPMASWFYDVKHYVPKQQHAVERIRQLFAESLGYTLPENETGDYAIAPYFLENPPDDSGSYCVFLHSTTRNTKHWTEQQWRGLIELMSESRLSIKLPWGTQHEYERALRLAEGFDYAEVLPKSTLAEIATILAGAKAVVSVDTGLSHLAAALDKPNITLYGPTDPGLIGGYGKNQIVMKAADNHMASITAEAVFDKLQSYLD